MSDFLFSIFKSENFIDLGIYQTGWEACTPAYLFGPSARSHYLFHYIIKGRGKLMAQDENGDSLTYALQEGEGFMLFPNQIATYIADEKDPWQYMWIEFDGLRVPEFLSLTSLSRSSCRYKALRKEFQEQMVKEMDYIVHHTKDSSLNIIGHLFLFFDGLIRSIASESKPRSARMTDYYLKEAIHFIEQNYMKPISIAEISEILGIDRSYFGKIFRGQTGQTPQAFLIQYRMAKAAELLRLTNRSIQDISLQVGYDNPLHFSRAFKSVYSLSPKKWRDANQENRESKEETPDLDSEERPEKPKTEKD